MSNKKFLNSIGIKDKRLQKIAVDKIPCGETSVETVLRDTTLVQVNAPRALEIISYKGLIRGLTLAEEELL